MASITVTPDPLAALGSATICVTGGEPGQPVTVTIDNGVQPTPAFETVEIALNDEGEGCKQWPVPGDWDTANFNIPGCPEVSRLVVTEP